MTQKRLMLGNEALALGLLESGCQMATAYPGTPSSEILSAAVSLKKEMNLKVHAQWAVNEKVAFETAYAGAQAGLRTAVAMKQVGLNVAADPLMSSVYLGVKGGFVVVSADDPGPHSSQTEQDSRLMAVMAKMPVLDPDSPAGAREMASLAFDLSEAFEIPVMIRPTTRVCHSRQGMTVPAVSVKTRQADFEKNPGRWAATPKFRLQLHRELEKKLEKISEYEPTRPRCIAGTPGRGGKAIVVAGVAGANARDIVLERSLDIPVFQVIQPFPLHRSFMDEMAAYDDILVLEETWGVIEMQFAAGKRVRGKNSSFVPRTGELLPENVEALICDFAQLPWEAREITQKPGRRPTLCAGCPHRAAFFAIKKAAPKGIFTSDIGCYTLGANLGAVDTVTCMGAGISQAAGFSIAYQYNEKSPKIFSTIGDSTFFHSGIPGLIETVVKKIPYVLVILDNRTTAMTGHQPTPASGTDALGDPCVSVDISKIAEGCGVGFIQKADPYDLTAFVTLLKQAQAYCLDNGPAVVISEHPCILDMDRAQLESQAKVVEVDTDICDGCGYCVSHFECPALSLDDAAGITVLDPALCSGCGVCASVCPKSALQIRS